MSITPVGHVIYLHGFASSPGSSKAARFAAELGRHGVGMSAPDFNQPAFETLTVTRMLQQTADAVVAAEGDPVALIGSSLGAFVALHAAARDGTVLDRLILLAPALAGGNRRVSSASTASTSGAARAASACSTTASRRGRLRARGRREVRAGVDLKLPMRRRDASTGGGVGEGPQERRSTARGRRAATSSMDEIWRESERFLGLKGSK